MGKFSSVLSTGVLFEKAMLMLTKSMIGLKGKWKSLTRNHDTQPLFTPLHTFVKRGTPQHTTKIYHGLEDNLG